MDEHCSVYIVWMSTVVCTVDGVVVMRLIVMQAALSTMLAGAMASAPPPMATCLKGILRTTLKARYEEACA